MAGLTSLPLDGIRTDGGTQPRALLQDGVVADYAEALAGGAAFPPVTVFYDGESHWLADGFHRVAAHRAAGRAGIDCDVRPGTRRDAVLFSAGANIAHGLRRTDADKQRAVRLLLDDAEWSGWSDREIARRCAVSHPFVARLRAASVTGNISSQRRYLTRHGTEAVMETGQIGSSPPRQVDPTARDGEDTEIDAEIDEFLDSAPDPASSDPVATAISAAYARIKGEREAVKAAKKARRAEREQALASKIADANLAMIEAARAGKRYGVILADPEWRFETYGEGGKDRSAENHYPCTPTDEICRRPVRHLAAADAVLLLWATAPMLPDALRVMEAWGFAYKTHCVWKKQYSGAQTGTGYWFRNAHELLLIGARGKIPAPAPGEQWTSVQHHLVGKHSQKPDFAHRFAEEFFPNLPKIELNARVARPGWDAWGAEAPGEDSPLRLAAGQPQPHGVPDEAATRGPVDPDGEVVKGEPDETLRLDLKAGRAPAADIQLHRHDDGRWMWATSYQVGDSGGGYKVGPKWNQFAPTRRLALFAACAELRLRMDSLRGPVRNKVTAWLTDLLVSEGDATRAPETVSPETVHGPAVDERGAARMRTAARKAENARKPGMAAEDAA